MRDMGRVFKRGTVYWIAYSFQGKEYRESSKSESESQAKKLLRKRIGEIGTGKLIGPQEDRVLFDDLARDLILDYTTNKKRYISAVQLSIRHLREFFGGNRALLITTDRVRVYIGERQEEGAANASINRELAALKRMFTLAVQAGKLSRRPYVPMLEENNQHTGFLDHKDFLALRSALPEYLRDPIHFLYLTGWRVSEMRSLEWQDVDFLADEIRLRPEISKNKTGRTHPLSGELKEIILRARRDRVEGCPFVFHYKQGRPLGYFRKSWNTAIRAAGLPNLIVHDLRRTSIRSRVRSGTPERVAMTLSGHKTRAIFDRYCIVSNDDLQKAARRMDQYLEQQASQNNVEPVPPVDEIQVSEDSETVN